MRLSSKIFLTAALVIVVLAGVGFLSLRAVRSLVSVNRDIVTRTGPALRLTASAREAISPLRRLEARATVLGDDRYARAWSERAERVTQDLEGLTIYVPSEPERLHLGQARIAFAAYRRVVAEEHALVRGRRAATPRLANDQARALAEQVEASLDGLMAATHTRALTAQVEAERLETRTWTAVLVALGAAVVLALVGSGIIARRMTRSLRLLSSATAEVAAGAFCGPIAVESRDEIAALARSFNTMASQLRQTEATKTEFFATLSHELRSPITAIRGAADLLRDGAPGGLTDKQDRLAAVIAQSSERLLRLVNQILELSRLRAGVLELDRKPLDLASVTDRVVEELSPWAEEVGLVLECARTGKSFACCADEERLHQLILNLGANAIRFTPRGGRVVFRLVDAGQDVELQVEDTGIGISADALPHIFDAYRQAHRDRGGTGLGLAIVRGVVDSHGGRVTVVSEEGKGSRFTVLLPRSGEGSGLPEVPSPRQAVAPERQAGAAECQAVSPAACLGPTR